MRFRSAFTNHEYQRPPNDVAFEANSEIEAVDTMLRVVPLGATILCIHCGDEHMDETDLLFGETITKTGEFK